MNKKKEILYKIIVLGDKDSKKSGFIHKYIYDDKLFTTTNFYNNEKIVTLYNGKTAKILIFDMAYNDAHFNSLRTNYYKSANGIIIIYNVNRRNSFEYAKSEL